MIQSMLLQIEREILGFLCYADNQGDKFEIIEYLELDDFQEQVHREIYKSCVDTFVRLGSIDPVSVSITRGKDDISIPMTELPPRDYWPEIRVKMQELKGRTKLKRLNALIGEIKQNIEERSINDHVKVIEDFIFNEYRADEKKVNLDQTVEELLERGESGRSMGFDWMKSVPTLSNCTGGIEKGKLYVVGASKKSGKTRFAVAVMKSLIQQGERPTFQSMEMREVEISKLLLSAFSGISSSVFTRRLAPFEVAGLKEKKDQFVDKITVDVASFLTIEQLRAKIWRASNRGSSVCVIDYLQRMNFPETRGRNHATIISDTVARIADMGTEYGVAIILLSQLRNEAENETLHDMSYLKDSGGIAESADAILILNNKQRQAKGEDKFNHGEEIELFISVEQRSGESRLIKTNARLGRMEFLEQTDRII